MSWIKKKRIFIYFSLFDKMAPTKDFRAAVVSLFDAGKKPMDIFNELQSLGCSRNFVYYTIKRYNETNSVEELPRCGRPRSVRTVVNVKVIRERIRRNPYRTRKNRLYRRTFHEYRWIEYWSMILSWRSTVDVKYIILTSVFVKWEWYDVRTFWRDTIRKISSSPMRKYVQ